MTGLELLLSGATLVLTVLLGLLLFAYLPSYVKKKAKNLATKEDIAEITDRVEEIRAEFSKKSVLFEKRREVYERISDSLRIFISGHSATPEQQNSFHAAYSACWLWAPDDVLINLNRFIRMQQEVASKPDAYTQDELKDVYGEIILGMRKDVGFPDTALEVRGYIFVQF